MLHERFMAVADELMVASGWTASDEGPSIDATFVRPVADGFIATADLCPRRGPIHYVFGNERHGQEPPLSLSAMVGVGCPSATRVVNAVSGWRSSSAISEEVGELLSPPREVEIPVAGIEEMRPGVASLVALVNEVAMPFATSRASFDALMTELPYHAGYRPGLLLAFGRSDEARDAIGRFEETADSPGARRFARQFRRLLDGEVTLETLESAMESRPGGRDARAERRTFREAAERQREMREALEVVRRSGEGMTRDQRRVSLQVELERRGVPGSALGIEAQLDMLEPGYERPSTLGVLASFGKGVVSVVRLLRSGESLGPEETPAWVEPPEQAAYHVTFTALDQLPVVIDADAQAWLDRVYAALESRIGSTVPVTVWLDHATALEAPRLTVAIGAQRVGLLDEQSSQRFAGAMAAARARDELPQVLGALTRRARDPKYVLTIHAPEADAAT